MKRILMILMILSLGLSQPAWAGASVRSNESTDNLSPATMGTSGRLNTTSVPEWTDHSVHDPGITILEIFRFTLRRIHRALARFGDAIRGRIPPS